MNPTGDPADPGGCAASTGEGPDAGAAPEGAGDLAVAGPAPVPLIRPALEAAWVVARAGLAATPPIQPPRGIRPLLHFARLPAPSLATVRAVVDEDPEFRARVAGSIDEAATDRASWLWLHRPDGWADELAELAADARRAAHHAHEGRAERSARRRLDAAEAARARSEAAAEAARRSAAQRLEELSRERQARRAAETVLAAVVRRAEVAEEAADRARRSEAAAEDRAAAARAGAAEAVRAGSDSERERARLATEVDRLTRALEAATADAGRLRRESGARRARAGGAVHDAARAAQALGAALARAAEELAGGPAGDPPDPGAAGAAGGRASHSGAGAGSAGAPSRAPAPYGAPEARTERNGAPASPGGATRPARGRRRPLAIPPGLFGDSVEAAVHLVRHPDVLLLVDGYNVSLGTWPGRRLPEQRQRLISALGELAARTGAQVHVVFDASAEEELPPPPGERRRAVRASFSATGEDADEVLIDLVDRADPQRPVVVATDDRRVRAEVERRGANPVSVAQLLGVLGRRPHDR